MNYKTENPGLLTGSSARGFKQNYCNRLNDLVHLEPNTHLHRCAWVGHNEEMNLRYGWNHQPILQGSKCELEVG